MMLRSIGGGSGWGGGVLDTLMMGGSIDRGGWQLIDTLPMLRSIDLLL